MYEWESEAQAQTGTQQLMEWLQSRGIGQQIDDVDAHSGEVVVSS